MNLEFDLSKIDRVATIEKAEESLDTYRMYLLTEQLNRLPKVTQTFTLVPPTNTNEFHSSTEDAAVANVDYLIARERYINRMTRAINRLRVKHRQIIVKRFMEEYVFDYEVYRDLNISERTYHRWKSEALYQLAFALGIEVYKEGEGA